MYTEKATDLVNRLNAGNPTFRPYKLPTPAEIEEAVRAHMTAQP